PASQVREKVRNKRRLRLPRWEGLLGVRSVPHPATACRADRVRIDSKTFGRFLFRAQPPGARMAVRKKTVTRRFYRVYPYAISCGSLVTATIIASEGRDRQICPARLSYS